MEDDFNADTGRLQQQTYTVYRDMRSWTAAIIFRVIDDSTGPIDYTFGFTFSLKATPSQHVGQDTVNGSHYLGE